MTDRTGFELVKTSGQERRIGKENGYLEKIYGKRWIAGALAFAVCCTAVLSAGITAAAETDGIYQEQQQTEVQAEKSEAGAIPEIDADPELALTITAGDIFEIMTDFTGIGLKDGETAELKMAAMEDGTEFDVNVPGTYKCVYKVTSKDGNAYLIARYITVTPRENETTGEDHASAGSGEMQDDGETDPEVQIGQDAVYTDDDTQETDNPSETETETEDETEPGTETEPETGVETGTEAEPETEDVTETETEAADETETVIQTETGQNDGYQVTIAEGEEYNIRLNHEDGRYDAGERVEFSADVPDGSLTAVAALLIQANEASDMANLLYAEVTYHADSGTYSFVMPEGNISLKVFIDVAEGSIIQPAPAGTGVWEDAVGIKASTFEYYSDGMFHPFDSVMGSGGNASYKNMRYEANGKTYKVNAYGMQQSIASPPSGITYDKLIELDEGGTDKYLRKALFYGYGGPGWGDTFNGYNIKAIMEKYGCTSEIRDMQHYLVSYLYGGKSGLGGTLSVEAKDMLKEIRAALSKMPDPGAMKLLPGLSVKAAGTKTGTFTWKANKAFTITLHLENGVSLINETTGTVLEGNVTVKGGEKFYLVATTDNTGSLKGNYAITSNYPLDYHAMLLKLENSQDIGFGYYTDSAGLSLSVEWPEQVSTNMSATEEIQRQEIVVPVYGNYQENDYSVAETKPAVEPTALENAEPSTEDATETEKEEPQEHIIKVEISITDIMDSKEIPGTMLAVYDKDGKMVESWISKGSPHRIENLPIGRYILREMQAPNGYLAAEDVEFEVMDTGETQKVRMKVARPAGRLILKVTEQDSQEPLEGAVFELKEKESGKIAARLVTDQEGIAKNENLPTAIYKDGKFVNLIEYVLVETKAPKGYEADSEEIPIVFQYLDSRTKEISITKELTNEKMPETAQTYAPTTRDKTNIWFPVFLLILSLGGIAAVVVVWYLKKRE